MMIGHASAPGSQRQNRDVEDVVQSVKISFLSTDMEEEGDVEEEVSKVHHDSNANYLALSSMVLLNAEAVWTNGGPPVVVAPDLDQGCDDTIECSSSFGDTSYGFGGEADDGEPEVNSVFSAHASGCVPRRRNVTDEWRNSVLPILWRCQWLELRMKELSSQVSKYDRELALIKKEKEIQQPVSKANGSMSESMHSKQNQGGTGGLLIDDDRGSTVDGSIRGELDAVTLLDSENYDTIFEQLTLKRIVVTIDGLQSRVHLLQDCISKAHSGGENLAPSEDNTHVSVPQKGQHTQKHSLSYTKCRYTKPQKRKHINILLKDDYGSTLSGSPALPDRETEFDGNIRGELDTDTLPNSENYDTIFEQLTLKGTLVTIDGLQSRVHLLQDCLSKAHSGGENLAPSEDNTHVSVPQKGQHTQNHSFSYTKCRTKPRKRKNLNILLKDDYGSILSGRPALPDRETDVHIKDANTNAEERSGECNHSRKKTVIVDLLLGTANFTPNCHIGDLCKGNTDDILIDNACQQLDNAKHLPSGTSSKGQNISGPAETKSTCAPVEAKNSCAPVVEPVSPQRKQEPKPKKMMKKRSFSTKKQRKEDSKTHATKKITEDVAAAAKNKTRSTLSAAAAEKTERKPSGAPGPGTMTACSAGKKHKTGNEPPDKKCESLASKKQETVKLSSAAKKQETVKLSSAAKKLETVKLSSAAKKQETMKLSSSANRQKTEKPSSTGKKQETMKLSSSANRQKTENPSSAGKKQKTENPSSAAKQQETENMPSSTKETESSPLNLKIEKSVVVAVNSRRSQRVRKPKVFAE
ncbi:hypothetical protein HU200_055960 [Digitaria exilis]|uniref:Uncharacterized protein n=1 Tax=Digitaria exilis TaxID=1010633 RepID=A0A835AIZ4_9POAL|nr:hypothetical protein HU200_055960 [Digitaria exilis]